MATQTVYTNNDTFAYQSDPDDVKGSDDRIYIDKESGYESIGYIGFDISSSPASSQVSSVVIHYYDNAGASGSYNSYFRRTTSSWVESTLTWNIQPTNTATNETTCSLPQNGSWGSCNVTNIYKDAKNAGSFFGIRMKAITSETKVLASKEYSGGTYKAYIVITYSLAADDYYVKTTGNDSLSGTSWANAWKTINKAATTVPDGSTVHIGFGTYDAEPAANKIAPQNIGASGIYYLPETATTGGGTGTVSIEQNT